MSEFICPFCGKVGSLPQAMDDGWIPSFWDGDDEKSDPVCPECVRDHLVEAANGELEVKKTDQPTIISHQS